MIFAPWPVASSGDSGQGAGSMRIPSIPAALTGVGLVTLLSSLSLAAPPKGEEAKGEDAPPPTAGAPEEEAEAGLDDLPIGWKKEGTAKLGTQAKLDIPEGYRFAKGRDAVQLLTMMGNMPSEDTLGLIGPDDLDWFAIYEFEAEGYIEDASKDDIDADDLLESLRDNADAANEMRRERGISTVVIDGWAVPPTFNEQTKVLEWATLATFTEPDGTSSQSVNFFTKVLGRRGFMDVVLVCGPDELDAALPKYRSLMAGYAFEDGERYDQYVEGDKIAEYGLAALVVGGAAAVGAKMGLFAIFGKFIAKMGKLVIVAVVAIGAGIANLFKKLFGRKD